MTPHLDSVGMFDLAAALPEQVAAAARLDADLDGLPAHDDVEHVVVLGVGDGGIAGEVVRAVAAPFLPVPLTLVTGYEPPSFVSESTLCFAVSSSGAAEETLEAAQEAATAGARMVVLSHGGALADLAASWDAPHLQLPELPVPRAGIGAVSIPVLLVLERVGLYPGATQYIADAVAQLQRRRDELIADGSVAHRLARRIGGTIPLAYGGDAVGEVAARRFKAQVNLNAKAPAFWGAYPEACHDEVCGWGQHGDVTRQLITAVRFRHDFEHPQIARRFELTMPLLDEVVHDVADVQAAGEGELAELLDLVLQGDLTSLHLATQAGVDPGPTPILDDLEAAVAR